MKLEDKRLIAEWMGVLGDCDFGNYSCPLASEEKCTHKSCSYLKNWNPDTNPLQFGEVWETLTPGQQQLVLSNTETMDTAEIISAILSKKGLAEFCRFILEVIK